MDKQFAIFDMDGTLIDSMRYWRGLYKEFLGSRGISYVPPKVLEQIKPMTMLESAAVFIREFGLEGAPEGLAAEMNALMEAHYRADILLKPGVRAYLEALRQRGVQMCVASATAERLVELCLRRLGIREYFRFLLSCEAVGAGKNRPDVYLAAAERLGCLPADAAVYEDALYAAATAKRAGFYVVGVYDGTARQHWGELTALADEAMDQFKGETA